MKAVVVKELGGPEVLKMTEVPRPQAAEDEVIIKVEAASVNFADIKARKGEYHGVSGKEFIPGLDCAGVVEETGSGVKHVQPGDAVAAFPAGGSYAEYVTARKELVYKLPPGTDTISAGAALTVGVTSYNVLKKVARLEPGETVLIHAAAGGVGTTAVQLAKYYGAGMVIGTVGSEEKKETALKAGADHVINYRKESFASKVMELTDQKGADVILDTISGKNFEEGLTCLAPFGRIVIFGHANDGSVPGNLQTDALHASCRAVLGYSTGTYRKKRPEFLKEGVNEIMTLLNEGHLSIMISTSYSLQEAASAHQLIESRKSTGKVMLLPM
jgi:NADPH:quinone reductase